MQLANFLSETDLQKQTLRTVEIFLGQLVFTALLVLAVSETAKEWLGACVALIEGTSIDRELLRLLEVAILGVTQSLVSENAALHFRLLHCH